MGHHFTNFCCPGSKEFWILGLWGVERVLGLGFEGLGSLVGLGVEGLDFELGSQVFASGGWGFGFKFMSFSLTLSLLRLSPSVAGTRKRWRD